MFKSFQLFYAVYIILNVGYKYIKSYLVAEDTIEDVA